MKYIIDVPEDRISAGRLRVLADMENSMTYWIETGIRVTPYEESSDTAEDAWNFAGRLFGYADDAILEEEIGDCYGMSEPYNILDHMSYKEAKEQYEAWKKEKDEIHVGDEVVYNDEPERIAVVTKIIKEREAFSGVGKNGEVLKELFYGFWHKTGRRFPEVAELLKKMRETE